MKRKAADNTDMEPPAKAARLEVERVLPPGQTRTERDQLLATLFEDEVEAGRWQLGMFEALRARYPTPEPEYKSARVTETIPNPYGRDAVDSATLLPIKVAQFLDVLKPRVSRSSGKYDDVDLKWGDDIDWMFSESSMDEGYTDGTWKDLATCDEWHDEIEERRNGWEAYDYFMAHYEDADRDDKTLAILKRKDEEEKKGCS